MNGSVSILVADFVIEVQDKSFSKLIKELPCFKNFITDKKSDFKIITDCNPVADDIEPNPDNGLDFGFEGVSCRFYQIGNIVIFSMREDKSADSIRIRWALKNDFVEVSVSGMSFPMGMFSLWMAVNMLMIPHKCAAVHSSVNVFADTALMFLGESGTGKSTHTRLLRERFPSMWLLNDDSPFVRIFPDGHIMVYGSPWSGKTSCYNQRSFPLRALVRLSQASSNKMYRLGPLASIGALLPSAPPAFNYVSQMADMNCDFVSDLVANVPVYHLECLPDIAAAELSYSTLFKL